jgi:hypothetical protein
MRALVLTALVSVLAISGVARAQSASETALGREQFRAGLAHARAERWAEALPAFRQAYELTHRPAILINVATAEVELGHLVEGAEAFRLFLREDHEGGDRREAAERALAELEPRIPRLRLQIPGLAAGDEIHLGDEAVSRAALGSPLPIDPGSHVVTVVRGGREIHREAFDVAERDTREITISVLAPAEPEPTPAQPTVDPTALDPSTGPAPTASGGGVDGGIVALVVILGVLAVGGGVGAGVGVAVSSSQPTGFEGNLGSWVIE